MSQKITIGGNRLGSGKKMKVTQRGYDRSTDNLSTIVRTSAAPGVLIPVYNNIVLPGDTWDIDIDSIVRTLPTVGPLFGSFKQQVDVFFCPARLYQGIMHNNPVDVGMQMDKVIFPKIALYETKSNQGVFGREYSATSLLRYLGITSIGTITGNNNKVVGRKFEALDFLAYYDIFKNYYANKQEENAKVIQGKAKPINIDDFTAYRASVVAPGQNSTSQGLQIGNNNITPRLNANLLTNPVKLKLYTQERLHDYRSIFDYCQFVFTSQKTGDSAASEKPGSQVIRNLEEKREENWWVYEAQIYNNEAQYPWLANINLSQLVIIEKGVSIQDFPLKNIDKMRNMLLAETEPGTEVVIGTGSKYSIKPYAVVIPPIRSSGPSPNNANFLPMNGLVLKTYQNDILNNWINKEWIDGDGVNGEGNPISYITRVDTSAGYFTMDTLNVAQKLYNSMIEVAVRNGTIDAWQSAIYNVDGYGLSEIPTYIGGMSGEVVFEEVVSQSETETEASGNSPIGTLAGKGTLVGKKGGKITYRAKEPGIIMAILSLTPRIDYSQGNKWHISELGTMDDLHKPALDGIGFQDLLTEYMDAKSTYIQAEENGDTFAKVNTLAVGKTPAWQWYRTDINRTYGDFAEKYKSMFMTLNRQYETDADGTIEDATAYIDPTKYNYCFADASLTAQNFWVQIKFDIELRHVMSARNVLPYMR